MGYIHRVCVCVRACLSLSVCENENQQERERGIERERETETEDGSRLLAHRCHPMFLGSGRFFRYTLCTVYINCTFLCIYVYE